MGKFLQISSTPAGPSVPVSFTSLIEKQFVSISLKKIGEFFIVTPSLGGLPAKTKEFFFLMRYEYTLPDSNPTLLLLSFQKIPFVGQYRRHRERHSSVYMHSACAKCTYIFSPLIMLPWGVQYLYPVFLMNLLQTGPTIDVLIIFSLPFWASPELQLLFL